jgi:hypothetical protein
MAAGLAALVVRRLPDPGRPHPGVQRFLTRSSGPGAIREEATTGIEPV